MLTFYLCFLAGGAVLPVFNYVIGFLSNGFGGDMHGDIDSNADFHGDIHTDLHGDIHTDLHSDLHHDIHLDHHLGDVHGGNASAPTDANGDGSFLSIGLIPTSLLSLSAFAVVFGTSGALMTLSEWNFIVTLLLSAGVGYLMAVIIQTIINSLKKAQTINSGISENELALYDGKIVDTILPGQYGTVSFSTLKNVLVSYPAKCADENIKLEAGKIVAVKEFKNGIFIVEPKNKYE